MEYTRVISVTVSCLLLLQCVDAQNQFTYDPNTIFFFDDNRPPPNQPLPIHQQPLAGQQPLGQQPLSTQSLGVQPWNTQQSWNTQQPWQTQQPFGNQPSLSNQPLDSPNQPATNRNRFSGLSATQKPINILPSVTPRYGVDSVENLLPLRDAGSSNTQRAKQSIHLNQAAAALTNFTINLMKKVSYQTKGNTVLSPYSIATLLALLQQGATGGTLNELSAALQMDPRMAGAAYKSHTEDIKNRNSRNIIRSANNIFLANGFTLNPGFRAAALRDFSSDVTPTNFALAAETAEAINAWVSAKTDHKIERLIAPDAITINTQMVLVNAMYFKGLWEVPFRKEKTMTGEFLLSSGERKPAKFMTTRRYFRTGVDSYTASKVIMIPFEKEEYSLMVILPNRLSNLADTISSLTVARLEEYLNFPYLETRLELPKFSVKADTELTYLLKQMGVSKLFAGADLSNIGTYEGQSPQVSTAVHSAAFTIDEEGGAASASTAFAVVALSNDEPSVIFKANSPFVAVLWDGKSKVPLFVGKIEDPSL